MRLKKNNPLMSYNHLQFLKLEYFFSEIQQTHLEKHKFKVDGKIAYKIGQIVLYKIRVTRVFKIAHKYKNKKSSHWAAFYCMKDL